MAHIRSILPQKGGVAPVDSNTTALFHYDDHARDSLRSIRPKGEVNAIQFASASSSFVDITTTSALTTVSTFTLSAWINPSTLSPSTPSLAVYVGNDGGGYGFGLGNGTGAAGSKLQGLFGGVTWIDSGYTFPNANQWYYVAMKRDSTGTTKFYVNGSATSGTVTNTPATIQSKVTIGGMYSGGNSSKTRYYDGTVSDVTVWNTAISDSDIAALSNGVDSSTAPVGRWKLNEGTGTTVHDVSNTGNDGVTSAITWTNGWAYYKLVSGGYQGGNGKGVWLEETTTNLLSSNQATGGDTANSTADWAANWGTTITRDTTYFYSGTGSIKAVTQGANPDEGASSSYTSAAASTAYTFSGWIMTPNSGVTVNAKLVQSGVGTIASGSNVTLSPNQWTYFTLTATTPSTFNGNLQAKITTAVATATTLYNDQFQIEQKGYATTWVNGTRPPSTLSYPIISFRTLSGWWKVSEPTGVWQNIAQIYEGGATPHFYFEHYNASGDLILRVRDGVVSDSSNNITVTQSEKKTMDGNWHYFAIVLDDTNGLVGLYVDDLYKSIPFANVPTTFTGHNLLDIGSKSQVTNERLNGMIDELRIDSIVRTDAEIRSWYTQGRNGW